MAAPGYVAGEVVGLPRFLSGCEVPSIGVDGMLCTARA
jgi:hypothetical protein